MKRKSIRNICLSLLAAATVLTVGVNSALAYFTTFTTAEGGLPIHLGDRTEITESFDSKTKHIVVTSDPESEPVYIRARAFCARYDLTYKSNPEGTWTQEKGSWNQIVPDGESNEYWYYKEIVNGGGSTTTLDVVIDIPSQPAEATPDQPKLEDGDSFNVIVIYESTPVRYNEDGNPYADWTETLDVVTATGKTDEAETGGSGSEDSDTPAIEDGTGDTGNQTGTESGDGTEGGNTDDIGTENGAGGDENVGE